MNIAWSIGFRSFTYALVPQHTYVAWFIGGIIGALISLLLTNKVPKKAVLVSIKSLYDKFNLHLVLCYNLICTGFLFDFGVSRRNYKSSD